MLSVDLGGAVCRMTPAVIQVTELGAITGGPRGPEQQYGQVGLWMARAGRGNLT